MKWPFSSQRGRSRAPPPQHDTIASNIIAIIASITIIAIIIAIIIIAIMMSIIGGGGRLLVGLGGIASARPSMSVGPIASAVGANP
jgi:hypothetical protein